jgi:hypothetical protein
MNEDEHLGHLELTRSLQQAKPLVAPLFPAQKKKWADESQLAEETSAILAKYPGYYDEIHAQVRGLFPKPKS